MSLRKLANRFRAYRAGLTSPPLADGHDEVMTAGGTRTLYHSRFNPAWFEELDIVPGVIVDLGSFDGGDAFRFSRAFPDCRVVTVEADPQRFALVSNNLAGERVEVLNYAACATDGPVDWHPATIDGEVFGQGSIYAHTDTYRNRFSHVAQQSATQVEGRRFDTLCAGLGITAVDLLHMDIEGAEAAVLSILGAMRPTLVYMEFSKGYFAGAPDGRETHRRLGELGYRMVLDLSSDRLYLRAR